MRKKGVTLIILAITILVLTIIASTIIINTNDISHEAKLATFGSELRTIDSKVKEYYITYGVLPIKEVKEYSSEQLKALNTLGYEENIQNELEINNDEESAFYEIDFSALGITLEKRGKSETADDIYVISSTSNTVYYVRGMKIQSDIYFSLTNIAK